MPAILAQSLRSQLSTKNSQKLQNYCTFPFFKLIEIMNELSEVWLDNDEIINVLMTDQVMKGAPEHYDPESNDDQTQRKVKHSLAFSEGTSTSGPSSDSDYACFQRSV